MNELNHIMMLLKDIEYLSCNNCEEDDEVKKKIEINAYTNQALEYCEKLQKRIRNLIRGNNVRN